MTTRPLTDTERLDRLERLLDPNAARLSDSAAKTLRRGLDWLLADAEFSTEKPNEGR